MDDLPLLSSIPEVHHRPVGFVSFQTRAQAEQALYQLKGLRLDPSNNIQLRVEFARTNMRLSQELQPTDKNGCPKPSEFNAYPDRNIFSIPLVHPSPNLMAVHSRPTMLLPSALPACPATMPGLTSGLMDSNRSKFGFTNMNIAATAGLPLNPFFDPLCLSLLPDLAPAPNCGALKSPPLYGKYISTLGSGVGPQTDEFHSLSNESYLPYVTGLQVVPFPLVQQSSLWFPRLPIYPNLPQNQPSMIPPPVSAFENITSPTVQRNLTSTTSTDLYKTNVINGVDQLDTDVLFQQLTEMYSTIPLSTHKLATGGDPTLASAAVSNLGNLIPSTGDPLSHMGTNISTQQLNTAT